MTGRNPLCPLFWRWKTVLVAVSVAWVVVPPRPLHASGESADAVFRRCQEVNAQARNRLREVRETDDFDVRWEIFSSTMNNLNKNIKTLRRLRRSHSAYHPEDVEAELREGKDLASALMNELYTLPVRIGDRIGDVRRHFGNPSKVIKPRSNPAWQKWVYPGKGVEFIISNGRLIQINLSKWNYYIGGAHVKYPLGASDPILVADDEVLKKWIKDINYKLVISSIANLENKKLSIYHFSPDRARYEGESIWLKDRWFHVRPLAGSQVVSHLVFNRSGVRRIELKPMTRDARPIDFHR